MTAPTRKKAVERNALHAYLDDVAHEAWQMFATENGVSVTALLEALGLQLAQEMEKTGDACEVRQGLVKQARRVDADRRRR